MNLSHLSPGRSGHDFLPARRRFLGLGLAAISALWIDRQQQANPGMPPEASETGFVVINGWVIPANFLR